MSFPNSGAVSLNAFADEVGDSDNIHSMSEFYRKAAGPVYDIGDNSDIPTSGAISFSQLRGASAVVKRNTSDGVLDNSFGATSLAGYFNATEKANKVCHLTVDTVIGGNALPQAGSVNTGAFNSGDPVYVDITSNGGIHGGNGAPGSAGNVNMNGNGNNDNTQTTNNPNNGGPGGTGLVFASNPTTGAEQQVILTPGSDARILGGGGGGGGAGIWNPGTRGNGQVRNNPTAAKANEVYIVPPHWPLKFNNNPTTIHVTTNWNAYAPLTVNWDARPAVEGGEYSTPYSSRNNGNKPNWASNNASSVGSNNGNAGAAGQPGNAGNPGTGVAPGSGNNGNPGHPGVITPPTIDPNNFPTVTVQDITNTPLHSAPNTGWGIMSSGPVVQGSAGNPNYYTQYQLHAMVHSSTGNYPGIGSVCIFGRHQNVSYGVGQGWGNYYRTWPVNSYHWQIYGGGVNTGSVGNVNAEANSGNPGTLIGVGNGGPAGAKYINGNTHPSINFGDLDPGTTP